MRVTIDVDIENNEGTDSPWWTVIDPKQNFNTNHTGIQAVAGMITGPFFSRGEAQIHLDSRRYAFSSSAVVYCHSGYWSNQYKNAIKGATSAD